MKAQFEQVTPSSSHSFKMFEYEQVEFDAPWHYHPEYELTLIIKSNGVRYVGSHIENYQEGDLVLLGSELPHCWKNAKSEGLAKALVIQWQKDFVGENWLERPEFRHIGQMLDRSFKGIHFGYTTSLPVKNSLLSLHDKDPFARIIGFIEVLDKLALCSDYRLLNEYKFEHALNEKQSSRMDNVHNFVRNHYQEKIFLSDVAELVHMTEVSFSRFFSRVMKKSFSVFLNEYRINMASKLLIETDLQVIQISFLCGYESLPFFYRQFKKFKKMRPLDYRRQYQSIMKD
jgi:AraC-like DNA-binding protein/quercetin dioxygenase-like cupin family protein